MRIGERTVTPLAKMIGTILRRERLAQSKTMRDVSASAYIGLGYLSEVERGKKNVSFDVLENIGKALHLSLSDLFIELSAQILLEEETETCREQVCL